MFMQERTEVSEAFQISMELNHVQFQGNYLSIPNENNPQIVMSLTEKNELILRE